MFSNPSAGWVLMNSIYMIYFLPLSREPLTTTSTKFCASIGNFKSFFNIAELFLDEDNNEQTFDELRKVGIKTSNFWINTGAYFTFLLGITLASPFIFLISKLKIPIISLKTKEIFLNYKYSFFIRFWLQNYLIIGVYSLISLTLVIDK